jgi:hypothetical protein
MGHRGYVDGAGGCVPICFEGALMLSYFRNEERLAALMLY